MKSPHTSGSACRVLARQCRDDGQRPPALGRASVAVDARTESHTAGGRAWASASASSAAGAVGAPSGSSGVCRTWRALASREASGAE
jgi:hypothetical protein